MRFAMIPRIERNERFRVILQNAFLDQARLSVVATLRAASSWALEGLGESYRCELVGTGVDVAVVEPGG